MRHRRRRLLVHGAIFSLAGLAVLTLGSTSSSATQPGRYLEGSSTDVTYTCVGNDAATISLLASIQLSSFPLAANILTPAVEPSPSPGDDFDMSFTWNYTLGSILVTTAVDLGTEGLNIGGTNTMSAFSGATGPAISGTGASSVPLGDGTQVVGYSSGPFTGTFNRTAAVDSPIEFEPGTITSNVVTAPGGIPLAIICTPDDTIITLNDQTGVAPSTTTTSLPDIVTTTSIAGTATTAAVAAQPLPRTGSSSNLFLVLLALGLIDVGYLALSASRSPRHGRTS